MRTAPDTSNQPETVVTRRVFARRLVTGTVAATVPTVAGAATCGHPTTKPPTSLTWYSWGPEYPLPFTAGPGLNTRVNWMQVAIRPAKPLAFGTIDGTPVFGLPEIGRAHV